MALGRDEKIAIAVSAVGVTVMGAGVVYSLAEAALSDWKKASEARRVEDAAKQRRAAIDKEWADKKAAIIAEIESHLAADRHNEARQLMIRYGRPGGDAIARFNKPLEIAKARADLAALPEHYIIGREGAYSELMRLEPENPRWAKEYANAKKAADRERAHTAAAAAQQEREERAARKRAGVSIGMTQERVLESSWGRPQHVNRTTTVNGIHEQWVYGSRNYLYFDNGILTGIQN